VSIKARVGWIRMNKHLNVASCFEELDDILPHFMDVKWDSVPATYGMSAEAYASKTTLGRGKTRPSFLVTSWIVATRGALWAYMYRVVRFIPLQGWLLIRISATLLEMSDGLFDALNVELSTS
jgi:hypothetical protein